MNCCCVFMLFIIFVCLLNSVLIVCLVLCKLKWCIILIFFVLGLNSIVVIVVFIWCVWVVVLYDIVLINSVVVIVNVFMFVSRVWVFCCKWVKDNLFVIFVFVVGF